MKKQASAQIASFLGAVFLFLSLIMPAAPPRVYAAERVVVVQGDLSKEHEEANKDVSLASFQKIISLLRRANVPYISTQDTCVEKEGLPPASVAIFPFNPAISEPGTEHILRFIEAGGKIIVFYMAPETLLQRIGIARCLQPPPAQEPLTGIVWREKIAGIPSNIIWQPTKYVQVVSWPEAQAIATWRTASGNDTGQPAIWLHEAGIFLTSAPLALSEQSGALLLRGLIGKLAPTLWQYMLPTAPEKLGPYGRFASLAELYAYVARQAQTNEAYLFAQQQAEKAIECLTALQQALANENIPLALRGEEAARQAAEQAFWASYPSLPNELRGVWMHNYAEPSWPEAAQILQQAHFNVVFPYMMSGGVAFYRSHVLPIHPTVFQQGDFLAQAVQATKAVKLPLHARMLVLTTLFAPPEIKQNLRAAGRLMCTAKGESVDWLCPSHPANRQALVAAALELARYGVQGLQFDYLRYPGANTCFCGHCRQKFVRDCHVRISKWPQDVLTGQWRAQFAQWRREQITSLAAEISRTVRKQFPHICISAAVFLNWEKHRETFGQDWIAWLERGLVDFVCPMNYTNDLTRFEEYVRRQQQWIGQKAPWATGIGVYADGCRFTGPELLLEQIRLARAYGAQGFVIFNYRPALVKDYLPWLSLSVLREPAHCHWLRRSDAYSSNSSTLQKQH